MGSNERSDEKPLHIVSARRKEDGDCLGRKTVEVRAEELLLRGRIVHAFGVAKLDLLLPMPSKYVKIKKQLSSRGIENHE